MSLHHIAMLCTCHFPSQGPQESPQMSTVAHAQRLVLTAIEASPSWGVGKRGLACLPSFLDIFLLPSWQVFQCIFLLRISSAHHWALSGRRCLQQWVSDHPPPLYTVRYACPPQIPPLLSLAMHRCPWLYPADSREKFSAKSEHRRPGLWSPRNSVENQIILKWHCSRVISYVT